MDMIGKLFPQLEEGNLGPALVIGVLLLWVYPYLI